MRATTSSIATFELLILVAALPPVLASCGSRQPPQTFHPAQTADIDFGYLRPDRVAWSTAEARDLLRTIVDEDAGLRGIFAATARERAVVAGIAGESGDMQRRVQGLNERVARRWMSEDYLGATIQHRFNWTPPVALYEPGLRMSGTYVDGTNIIVVNPHHEVLLGEAPAIAPVSDADLLVAIAHEQHHYAASLGGGDVVRWGQVAEEFVDLGDGPYLFLEGLTEFFAFEQARHHGREPTSACYLRATAVAVHVRHLLDDARPGRRDGDRLLRRAYLTGDFTTVRRLVNQRLGVRSYERLLGTDSRIRRERAYCDLVRTMDLEGIDHRAWSRESVLMQVIARELAGQREAGMGQWFARIDGAAPAACEVF